MVRINYDEQILQGEKAAIHKENLKIAKLNLIDFNKRTRNNISILYEKFEFSLVNFEMDISIADDINFYINWFRNIELHNNQFQRTLYGSINSEFEQIIQDYRAKKFLSLVCKKDDVLFERDRNQFIDRYQNFHPIGILPESQENEIKATIENNFIIPIKTEIVFNKEHKNE